MVLEVEEYGDPAILIVIFNIGCSQQDLPLQGPWLFVVVVLYCGSMNPVSIRWLHCGE